MFFPFDENVFPCLVLSLKGFSSIDKSLWIDFLVSFFSLLASPLSPMWYFFFFPPPIELGLSRQISFHFWVPLDASVVPAPPSGDFPPSYFERRGSLLFFFLFLKIRIRFLFRNEFVSLPVISLVLYYCYFLSVFWYDFPPDSISGSSFSWNTDLPLFRVSLPVIFLFPPFSRFNFPSWTSWTYEPFSRGRVFLGGFSCASLGTLFFFFLFSPLSSQFSL